MPTSEQKRGHPIGFVVAFSAVFALLCGLASAQSRIYAKLTGVEGESQQADRRNWIDIIGLGSAISRDSDTTVARNAVASAGPFILRKKIDQSSPYLLRGMLEGQIFDELEIAIEGLAGTESTYRLRGVRLATQKIYSDATQSEMLEEVGFQYDVIEWHDYQTIANNEVRHVGSTWNLVTTEGGPLDQPDSSPPTMTPIAPLIVNPGDVVDVRVQLVDPNQAPEELIFTALEPQEGLARIIEVTGEGLTRLISIQIGDLQNGMERITLSLSDSIRSSTRILPIVIAGEQTDYESYLAGFLTEEMANDPNASRPLQDPDKDGISNVMEFFLGTDPASFTPRQNAFTMTRNQDDEGTEITISYYRRADATSLLETFEGSRDLKTWQKLGSKEEPRIEIAQVNPPTNGYALTEARVFIPAAPLADRTEGDATYYLRLSVKGSL